MQVGRVGPITTFEIRPVRKTTAVSRDNLDVAPEPAIEDVSPDGRKRDRQRRPGGKSAAPTSAMSTLSDAVLSALIDLQIAK